MTHAEAFCRDLQLQGARKLKAVLRKYRVCRSRGAFKFSDGSTARRVDLHVIEAAVTIRKKYWIGGL